MVKINIFVENTYEEFNIDEVKVFNNSVKITDYLITCKEVYEKSCLNKYKYTAICFDIVLANNSEIHRINKEYRQKDTPTDVITFAMFADSSEDERFILEGEINLGEIIIYLDKIEEQAKENNVKFEDELYYIISHGVLHLMGFDHLTEQDYNFMVDYQNKAKAIL